jgi:hypothetical protein
MSVWSSGSPSDAAKHEPEISENDQSERIIRGPSPAGSRAVARVRRHFVDLLTEEEIATLGDITERVLAHLTE